MQFSGNSVQKRVNSVQKRVNSVQKRVNSVQKRVNSVQKRVNSVQKRVNSVQRKKQIRHSDRSIIKETHRQPIKCEPWMSQQNLKICERNNGQRFR